MRGYGSVYERIERVWMNIKIKIVKNHSDLKSFVKFPFSMYADHPYWTPPLLKGAIETFSPEKNPAYQQAETRLFQAHNDQKVVGRIAGILSHAANEKYQTKNLRFGWFDTVEDYSVAEALLNAVSEWTLEKGMETVTGPHGFTNFDPQGLLIEGYDQPSSIHSTYNFPYYAGFVEKYAVMAVDNVFTAINSGEVDTAVSSFAKDAIVENRLRRERYVGATEIRQMLQGMYKEGRQFDIVGAEMYGDMIIVQVDVSDRGIVWGTETIVAEVKDGKLQTFNVTDFRLRLWG